MTAAEIVDPVLPAPLPWVRRGSAAPYVPGRPEELVGNLRALLVDIQRDPLLDREFAYPGGGKKITIRRALHALGSSGLVRRNAQLTEVALTEAAEQFLANGDELFLIGVLHANVRFFGEALAAIGDGLDHDALNRIASEEYGLSWGSLDQIRRRVYWLRGVGLVEHWTNGLIVLTAAGRQLLDRLDLVDVDDLPHRREHKPDSVELPITGPVLAERLAQVDQHALVERRRQLGYVAGGGIEAIRVLVDFAAAVSTTRAAFTSFCVAQFAVALSSAEQTLNSLRIMGLLVQVGPDEFAATDLARDWLSTGEAVDLLRVLHLNVSLTGETLDALGEVTDAGAVARLLADRYGDFAPSRAEVGRKIALFLEAGLVERLGLTLRQTALGKALAASLPMQSRKSDEEVTAGNLDQDPKSVMSSTDVIVDELKQAATDSGNPRRFERAVAEAFRALGLEVEQLGGPSKTDVLVEIWNSPTTRIRVAVEAKTDGAGIVTDRDVEFLALDEHRSLHRADRSVLIGPNFSGRVAQWAEQRQVGVLTVDDLSRALRRHRRTPLYPHEIAALLDLNGAVRVDEVWSRAERQQQALVRVVGAMWASANDPVDIEYSEGVLTPADIWRESKNLPEGPLEIPEIKDVLQLLASPLVAAAVPQGKGHVVTAQPAVVAARLRALAEVIDSSGPVPVRVDPEVAEASKSVFRPETTPQPDNARISPDLIRTWALEQGRPVSSRGRLPAGLVRDYKLAHGLDVD